MEADDTAKEDGEEPNRDEDATDALAQGANETGDTAEAETQQQQHE